VESVGTVTILFRFGNRDGNNSMHLAMAYKFSIKDAQITDCVAQALLPVLVSCKK